MALRPAGDNADLVTEGGQAVYQVPADKAGATDDDNALNCHCALYEPDGGYSLRISPAEVKRGLPPG